MGRQHFDSLVRTVDEKYRQKRGERLLAVFADGRVEVARSRTLWDNLTGKERPTLYCVRVESSQGKRAEGCIEGLSVNFADGRQASVDLRYRNLRLQPRNLDGLVTAVHRDGTVDAAFLGVVNAEVDRVVAALTTDDPLDWRRLRADLERRIRTQIGEQLGLTLTVRLQPSGRTDRPTRTSHGPYLWPIVVADVPHAVAFRVDFETEESPDLLPLLSHEEMKHEEVVRERVEQYCAQCELDHFGHPSQANHAIARLASKTLRAAGVLVRRLRIEPAEEARPIDGEQVRVRELLTVRPQEHEVSFELDLLLTLHNAGQAVALERRHGSAVRVQVASQASLLLEKLLATLSLPTIFKGLDDHRATLSQEVREWIEGNTGYRVERARLELLTEVPEPKTLVTVKEKLQIEPVRGRHVELEIHATLELDDPAPWMAEGCPDPGATSTAPLGAAAQAFLQVHDEVDVYRSESQVRDELLRVLEREAASIGYGVSRFRLDPGRAVRRRDRSLSVRFSEVAELGDPDTKVSVRGSARMELVDTFAFIQRDVHREDDWSRQLFAQVILRELGVRTRRELIVEEDKVTEAVHTALEEAVRLHGYELRRFVIRLGAVSEARPYVREAVQLDVRLGGHQDRVAFNGVVELEFLDRAQWFEAGEPDVSEGLEERTRRALLKVVRDASPGDFDERPEDMLEALRDALEEEFDQLGYTLAALQGDLTPTQRPPVSMLKTMCFPCKTGQRTLEPKVTVLLRLVSAADWRASAVRDLEDWMDQVVPECVRAMLLTTPYERILRDVMHLHRGQPATVAQDISSRLGELAASIGYEVDNVVALPDLEARELLDGFELSMEMQESSAWPNLPIHLKILVNGKFENFDHEAVRSRLTTGESVKNWLTNRVNRRVRQQTMELTPNDVFFAWAPPAGNTQQILNEAVIDELKGLGIPDPQVRTIPQIPPYIDRVRDLKDGPHKLEFTLPARHHHITEKYVGSFNVVGIAVVGSDLLFSRRTAPTAETIAGELGSHLTDRLSGYTQEDFHLSRGTDFVDSRHELTRSAREFCARAFGLDVELVNLARQSNEIERLKEQMELFLYRDQQHRLEVKQEFDKQRIELARQRNWDEIGRLEDVRHNLIADAGIATTKGPSGYKGIGTSQSGSGLPRVIGPPRWTIQLPPRSETGFESYESAEVDCAVHLRVEAHLDHQFGDHSTEAMLVSTMRAAIVSELRSVSPQRFWLEFDKAIGGQPSPEESLQRAVRAALSQASGEVAVMSVSFERPERTFGERLANLRRGRDLTVSDVEVLNRQDFTLQIVDVRFSIRDVADGHFARFSSEEPDADHVLATASELLPNLCSEHGLPRISGAPNAALKGAFLKGMSEAVGLRCELRHIKITQDPQEVRQLRAELQKLSARRAHLQGRQDPDSIARLTMVLEEIEQKTDRLRFLTQPKPPAASGHAPGSQSPADKAEI